MIEKDDLTKLKKIIHKLKGVSFSKNIQLDDGRTVLYKAIITGKLMKLDGLETKYINNNILFISDCDVIVNDLIKHGHKGFAMIIQRDFFNLKNVDKADFKLNDNYRVILKDLSEETLNNI